MRRMTFCAASRPTAASSWRHSCRVLYPNPCANSAAPFARPVRKGAAGRRPKAHFEAKHGSARKPAWSRSPITLCASSRLRQGLDHVGMGPTISAALRRSVSEDVSRFPHLFAELVHRGGPCRETCCACWAGGPGREVPSQDPAAGDRPARGLSGAMMRRGRRADAATGTFSAGNPRGSRRSGFRSYAKSAVRSMFTYASVK